MQLFSRERASPADRGIVPFDVFLGVLGRQLALLAPATVTEEKAFLIEVVVSAEKEWQEAEQLFIFQ